MAMGEALVKIGRAVGTPRTYQVELLKDNLLAAAGAIAEADLPATIRDDFLKGVPVAKLLEHGHVIFAALERALGAQWTSQLGDFDRIYLDIQDEQIAKLPWELMARGSQWLAVKSPLVRVKSWNVSYQGPAAHWPIRVMILVGTDDPTIAAAEEERRIRHELSTVHCLFLTRTLRNRDRNDLMEELGKWQPQILHFIGHGGQVGGVPCLRFKSANSWDWTSVDIATRFPLRGWTPTLVVLNACRSTNQNDELEVASVAGAFLDSGCRSVIAMQADIRGDTAGIYSGKLYENLARGESVDRALQVARQAVYDFSQTAGSNPREAAMASLTVSVPPNSLFATVLNVTDDLRQKLRKFPCFEVVSHFVNQVERREQVVTSLWPILASVKNSPMVVLRGPTGTGKTSLACWLMDLCLRTHHRVRYVAIDDLNPKNWLDVLRLIRGTDPHPVPILEPMPAIHFHEFHWQLKAWLSGKEPGVWDHSPVEDAELPLVISENIAKEPASVDEPLGGVFQTFRRALQSVASADHPLTLVLDHFSGLDKGNFWMLWDGLFQPIANGKLANVHMVLVLTDREYAQTYQVDECVQQSLRRLPNFAVCDVPLLAPDDFKALASELLERLYVVDPKPFNGFFDAARENVFRQDWPIAQLRFFLDESLGKPLQLVRRKV